MKEQIHGTTEIVMVVYWQTKLKTPPQKKTNDFGFFGFLRSLIKGMIVDNNS